MTQRGRKMICNKCKIKRIAIFKEEFPAYDDRPWVHCHCEDMEVESIQALLRRFFEFLNKEKGK
jgi:hypothetical protein